MADFDAMQDGMMGRIDAAEAAGIPPVDASQLRHEAASVFGVIRDARENIEVLLADPRYTLEHKTVEADRVRILAVANARERLDALEERLKRTLSNLERKAATPPPNIDPALLEARLANVRSDVRMALDNERPDDVPDALAELVIGADDVTRHLLLATDFGRLYLRGRGAMTHVARWERLRERMRREYLTPDGRRAAETLDRIRYLQHLPVIARAAVDMLERDNRQPITA